MFAWTRLAKIANSDDTDQTATGGAVRSGPALFDFTFLLVFNTFEYLLYGQLTVHNLPK